MAELWEPVVLTIESTPLGDFEMSWGITDLRAKLAALGIVYGSQDVGAGSSPIFCRDPRHGEETPVSLYRDKNGSVYAISEITNGIWVVGVAVIDEPASTAIRKEELASAVRSGELFVDRCDGNEISVACHRSGTALKALADRDYSIRPAAHGGPTGTWHLVCSVADDEAKAAELMVLRDIGIPFSGGREWNPTEVFEQLREQDLANGGYWSIWWKGPDRFEIRWCD